MLADEAAKAAALLAAKVNVSVILIRYPGVMDNVLTNMTESLENEGSKVNRRSI